MRSIVNRYPTPEFHQLSLCGEAGQRLRHLSHLIRTYPSILVDICQLNKEKDLGRPAQVEHITCTQYAHKLLNAPGLVLQQSAHKAWYNPGPYRAVNRVIRYNEYKSSNFWYNYTWGWTSIDMNMNFCLIHNSYSMNYLHRIWPHGLF